MPPTGRPAERRLAAVERALRVLDAFLQVRGDAGTTELGAHTGINASTVSRTLSTLVDAGYVEQWPTRAATGSAPTCWPCPTTCCPARPACLRPVHLESLEATLGETTTLSIPSEPDAITVDFVPSRASVSSVARIGRASVAHATATGKVMLAFARRRGARRPARAVHRAHHRRIRRRCGARSRRCATGAGRGGCGEREEHLNAIAAPVFGARGELAAILGVQGPDTPLRHGGGGGGAQVLVTSAVALSRELGYHAAAVSEMALPQRQWESQWLCPVASSTW